MDQTILEKLKNGEDPFRRKDYGPVMEFVPEQLDEEGQQIQMPLLRFPALEALTDEKGEKLVQHMFTTRLGGVSTGICESMNLHRFMGDDKAHVRENYRRVSKYMGAPLTRFVISYQVHSPNVFVATEESAGNGMTREWEYRDVDGAVTNVRGMPLGIFLADCVPVYFVDPVKKAIGLSHSGWKGTVGRISRATIDRMRENYGTDPADLVVGIGPSICQDCYEVSPDVAEVFRKEFAGHEDEIMYKGRLGPVMVDGKETGELEQKWQLSLWEAIRVTLLEEGVRAERISTTDICTNCNPDLLFSHRFTKGRRGLLGAFLMLR